MTIKKPISQLSILFALLVFSSTRASAHDLKLAFFEFSESKEGIVLEVTFDKEDLALALIKLDQTLEGEKNLQVWETAVSNYLTTHLKLRFDQEVVAIPSLLFSYDKDYVRMSVSLKKRAEDISSIAIWSDCLIKDIKGQSNIVKSRLHGRTRTFRLNKKRTSIDINY